MDKKDFHIVSKLVTIPLEKLHIRFIPMAQLGYWYKPKDGYNMMSLVNSPHVELMKIFRDHGLDWKRIKKTRYWNERRFRVTLGMFEWTKDHVKWHIKNRYKTFKSIKKHGFDPKKCVSKSGRDTSVLVHKSPFWCSRFGPTDGIDGYEIMNGAGRCSALLAMGHTGVLGKWIEDAKKGSCEWKNVTKRFL